MYICELDLPSVLLKQTIVTIIAKGGEYVGSDIFRNKEWFNMCNAKGVRHVCAAKRHLPKDCPVARSYKANKSKNAGSQDQLSALLDSAMETDLNYLSTLAEDLPLMLPFSPRVRFRLHR